MKKGISILVLLLILTGCGASQYQLINEGLTEYGYLCSTNECSYQQSMINPEGENHTLYSTITFTNKGKLNELYFAIENDTGISDFNQIIDWSEGTVSRECQFDNYQNDLFDSEKDCVTQWGNADDWNPELFDFDDWSKEEDPDYMAVSFSIDVLEYIEQTLDANVSLD